MNGFGLEFYIETPADEVSETIHDIKQSWQFQLLYTVSQLAAGERIDLLTVCCAGLACKLNWRCRHAMTREVLFPAVSSRALQHYMQHLQDTAASAVSWTT